VGNSVARLWQFQRRGLLSTVAFAQHATDDPTLANSLRANGTLANLGNGPWNMTRDLR
jgi:hypothetical protein